MRFDFLVTIILSYGLCAKKFIISFAHEIEIFNLKKYLSVRIWFYRYIYIHTKNFITQQFKIMIISLFIDIERCLRYMVM